MLLLGGGLTGAEVDEAFDRLKAFGAALIPPRVTSVRTAASETVNALAASAQLHGGGPPLAALERRNTPDERCPGSLAKVASEILRLGGCWRRGVCEPFPTAASATAFANCPVGAGVTPAREQSQFSFILNLRLAGCVCAIACGD